MDTITIHPGHPRIDTTPALCDVTEGTGLWCSINPTNGDVDIVNEWGRIVVTIRKAIPMSALDAMMTDLGQVGVRERAMLKLAARQRRSRCTAADSCT